VNGDDSDYKKRRAMVAGYDSFHLSQFVLTVIRKRFDCPSIVPDGSQWKQIEKRFTTKSYVIKMICDEMTLNFDRK
jgi:hypothetical protein